VRCKNASKRKRWDIALIQQAEERSPDRPEATARSDSGGAHGGRSQLSGRDRVGLHWLAGSCWVGRRPGSRQAVTGPGSPAPRRPGGSRARAPSTRPVTVMGGRASRMVITSHSRVRVGLSHSGCGVRRDRVKNLGPGPGPGLRLRVTRTVTVPEPGPAKARPGGVRVTCHGVRDGRRDFTSLL
jgi:hypothetical protein